VLGGTVVLEGERTIVKLANGWVTINVGAEISMPAKPRGPVEARGPSERSRQIGSKESTSGPDEHRTLTPRPSPSARESCRSAPPALMDDAATAIIGSWQSRADTPVTSSDGIG
jgi:hypothetical protein